MKKKKVIKEKIVHVPNTNIEGCTFYGVKWDAPALEVLATVAKGLTNLTELFKSQNVEIRSLLNIESKE